ncbi:hypothetical protein Leryth_012467 [Lithospermum erythrorhizon]|nr:hypothetical protein Leryth_012467 [Lithospermum erythrorhizon]
MSKLKNPAIKLFGKTIVHYHHHEQESTSSALSENKSASGDDFIAGIQRDSHINPTEDESVERETTSIGSESFKTPERNCVSIEMRMKKPEKILPCPRCSSMDTKFCYYNNYNVKQPRHFCKSCQRFWTAGGIMRNVAVGSGRRKNKGNCTSTPDLTKRPGVFLSAQGYGPQISCFSESPWPAHWNAVHFSSPASQDATFPSSLAVNFYPANPYYFSAVPGPWRTPPNQSMATTNPTSPLGKHLSDGSLLQLNIDNGDPAVESGARKYVMPKKALKIDNMNDAATRSIRSMKDSNDDSFKGSSRFRAFYPLFDGKNHTSDNSLILQANPAAFSRSMNFHERS